MNWNGKGLTIGDLESRLPIIQGGMGIGISLSGLAAAVANAGGIGVIAAAGIGMMEKDYFSDYAQANVRALKREIKKAREKTKGILGVNIMVALTHFSELAKASIEENIDIIFAGAGLPLTLPSLLLDGARTKLVPIVSSARAAALILKVWRGKYNYTPDAIVLEGPLAGGHLGFPEDQIHAPENKLEHLLTDLLDEVKKAEDASGKTIPVIVAGGIYTGADIHQFLQLGASGVQMATRFVTTVECDADDRFKQAYLDCKEEDIGMIKSPVGLPGRAIVNEFIMNLDKDGRRTPACPYHCLTTCKEESRPYCISLALMNAKRGIMEKGFAFAGVNAYRADNIISVEALMQTLTREYNEAASAGL